MKKLLYLFLTVLIVACGQITSNGEIYIEDNKNYLKNTSYDKKITFTLERVTINDNNIPGKVETRTVIETLNPGEIEKLLSHKYEYKYLTRFTTYEIVGELIEPQTP
jgi:hypothetical protein